MAARWPRCCCATSRRRGGGDQGAGAAGRPAAGAGRRRDLKLLQVQLWLQRGGAGPRDSAAGCARDAAAHAADHAAARTGGVGAVEGVVAAAARHAPPAKPRAAGCGGGLRRARPGPQAARQSAEALQSWLSIHPRDPLAWGALAQVEEAQANACAPCARRPRRVPHWATSPAPSTGCAPRRPWFAAAPPMTSSRPRSSIRACASSKRMRRQIAADMRGKLGALQGPDRPAAGARQAEWRPLPRKPEPMPEARRGHRSAVRKPAAFAAAAGARQGARQLCRRQRSLLMVASDRISAFDVVMGQPIPGKGRLLTRMALFWFARLAHVVPNHLSGDDPASVVAADERALVAGRSMLVKRLKPLPVEAVVRGYLAGSGWAEYQRSGSVCGVPLPAGLLNASRLSEPIFTPATKAEAGAHDENIDFAQHAATGRRRACRAACARCPCACTARRQLRAGQGHHHCRHEVRVRPGRGRHADADGRNPDARFIALLAARRLPRRHQPAQLRQAVPARLARGRARSTGSRGTRRRPRPRCRRRWCTRPPRAMPRRCAS